MAREIICDSCGERQEQDGVRSLSDHMQVILRLGGPHGDARDEIKIDLCEICRKKLREISFRVKDGQLNLRKEGK